VPQAPTPRGHRHLLAVAPMLDWTDRHQRRFVRSLTRETLLYSEMITAQAVLHGDRERLLAFDVREHPVALQLAGDNPAALAAAAAVGAAYGYDEINLNVGCPSERVQAGRFGACLMATPALVGEIVQAMRGAVPLPVTVKHRLGIDDLDSDALLRTFAATQVAAGCDALIVHARKAILNGLSPKENRSVPPLQHERVYALKRDLPAVRIVINGGFRDLSGAKGALRWVDGVMIGRAAIEDPYLLALADQYLYALEHPPVTRAEAVLDYLPYVEAQRQLGTPWSALVKPLIPLLRAVPGARGWRRELSEGQTRAAAGPEWIARALATLPAEVAHQRPTAASLAAPPLVA
jgi:tRNA-dihydrouridine synthase A